ncbi:MAG: hypothetical protein WBB45_13775 [Cyclobacteriaceae bacterium]
MERSNKPSEFEREWRDAFDGASETPSPRIWEGIESSLNQKKTRPAGWIWWAAASLFLMCAVGGGLFLTDYYDGDAGMVAHEQSQDQTADTDIDADQVDDSKGSVTANNSNNKAGSGSISADSDPDQDLQSNMPTHTDAHLYSQHSTPDNEGGASSSANIKSAQPLGNDPATADTYTMVAGTETISQNNSLRQLRGAGPEFWDHYMGPIAVTMYKVPDNAMFEDLEKENNDKLWDSEKLWTGLSFAGGSFNPSFDEGPAFSSSNPFAFSKNPNGRVEELDVDQEVQSTFSYDMSFNISGMLGKNFVWQSGLSYQRLNATSNTDMVIQDVPTQSTYPVLLSNYDAFIELGNKQVVVIATNTKTLNSFEFLTVPVKIGYVFGGEELQFLMSAGVSANIFMANTITSEDGSDFGSFETRVGDDNNPFRTVSYNGLISSEVMYRFAPNFSLSAGPLYQYSLGDLASEGSVFSSNPSTFLISTGIKYHFK